MPVIVPELTCVVCEKDAMQPREVVYCEACERLHHIKCSETLWVIRDGQEWAHIVCGNCYDEEDGAQ